MDTIRLPMKPTCNGVGDCVRAAGGAAAGSDQPYSDTEMREGSTPAAMNRSRRCADGAKKWVMFCRTPRM